MADTHIDWRRIHRIFKVDKLPKIIKNYTRIPSYVDREIVGKILNHEETFFPFYNALSSFIPSNYEYKIRRISTDMGKDYAVIRTWTVKGPSAEGPSAEKLVYILANEGYCAIYGSTDTFLVVGCYNCHPFVITPTFAFGNSDGSTDYPDWYLSSNLEDIKYQMMANMVSYLFEQVH